MICQWCNHNSRIIRYEDDDDTWLSLPLRQSYYLVPTMLLVLLCGRIFPRTVFFFFFEFPDFLMLMFSHVVWSHALDVSSSDKAWWLYYKNGDMNGASCCSLNIYYWAPAAPHVKNYCGWKWGLFQPFEAVDWFPNTG